MPKPNSPQPCYVGVLAMLIGAGWVYLLRYEVQVFFTGQDPRDIILLAPVLWIPGALLALWGLVRVVRWMLQLGGRTS
jgi:hypothetical protein